MSRCTHRLRRQRPTTRSSPFRVVGQAAATVLAVLCWSISDVDAATAPATIRQPLTSGFQHLSATPKTGNVDQTLQALDRLHSFGYSVNTPARADRAIRHWQHANGLTVDGIIGPQTLSSLTLPIQAATPAPAPAVRLTPPAPPVTDAETIIRDVWPDDLEDHAVAIATRESRLTPTARNSCCYGLFQIHWNAHRAWLADIGVTSPNQLLDPTTNATAAFALYQLDGWTPWAL